MSVQEQVICCSGAENNCNLQRERKIRIDKRKITESEMPRFTENKWQFKAEQSKLLEN
ncbi:MAG: hypothetical protein QXK37_05400 [Candidatus Woesearchaeota archaeon]